MSENEPQQEQDQQFPEYNNQFEDYDPTPRRHGCVTAWLIIMLAANSFFALSYAASAKKLAFMLNISINFIYALILVGAANIIFAILLLQWKKLGFYGFAASTAATFAINLAVGLSPVRSVLGLVGLGILYGILQIKQDGISAWEHLR